MSEMIDALGSVVFIEQLAVRWMFLTYWGWPLRLRIGLDS